MTRNLKQKGTPTDYYSADFADHKAKRLWKRIVSKRRRKAGKEDTT